MSPLSLSSTAILAISIAQPERLFSTPEASKGEFRDLVKKWHPDRNTDDPMAEDVAAHIVKLHKAAEAKIAAGKWEKPGWKTLVLTTGAKKQFHYLSHHEFELGEVFYGNTIVVYMVRRDFADLFHSAHRIISGLQYPSSKVKDEISRYMPQLRFRGETDDGFCVMVQEKTPDVFMLKDVVTALGGRIDPKHVAWILNSIYNLACYLQVAGLTHNAISLETVFISPKHHSSLLLGGWWYALTSGSKISALPSRAHRIASPDLLREKKADHRLDLSMIKAVGRELLGDVTGMALAGCAPKEMISFLKSPTGRNAMADYKAWGECLLSSMGPRRFVPLELSASDVFKGDTHG